MALEDIYEAYRMDPFFDHLRREGIFLVPGFGSRRPRVMVVGEAPGATENTRRRPFCGPSGRMLLPRMRSAGLFMEDVWSHGSEDHPETTGTVPANTFITNVVKYRPPGNRTPTVNEIEASVPYLRREWFALGGPKVIVAVGAVAKTALLPDLKTNATALVGRPIEAGSAYVWVMYHPQFVAHQQSFRELWRQHWESLGEWLRSEELI